MLISQLTAEQLSCASRDGGLQIWSHSNETTSSNTVSKTGASVSRMEMICCASAMLPQASTTVNVRIKS